MRDTAKNTDQELWRVRKGDYYADSLHVTASGKIGINCGGHVIVMPIREWHKLASENQGSEKTPTNTTNTAILTEIVNGIKSAMRKRDGNIHFQATMSAFNFDKMVVELKQR